MRQTQDFNAVREHWFKWMMNGDGKQKHSIGKYGYSGPIFYAEGNPSQRLLKNRHNEWVLMCRWYSAAVPGWAKNQVAVIVTPDIACFSTYDGDWYDEPDDIHNRVKFIMLSRVNAHIEDVERMTGKDLEQPHRSKPERAKLDDFYKNWNEYDHVFHLGWGKLPAHYSEKLERIINYKINAWLDPAAVERRKRAAARKAAKEALGLIAEK